ncbi:MAG: 6-aminopenicillanic acid acyl-transferase [Gammaproteobacteria bacterium]|nr:6-aminopenicillanic acid acyl-transferase [Gammaproteobacteria bacterium]
MSNNLSGLRWCKAAGTAREIGLILGRQARDAVKRHLLGSEIWHKVNSPGLAASVARMSETTQRLYPEIWAELEGLAEGLDLPLEQVMAWNCRGDLLESTADGCTTVQLPGAPAVIAHNEDGLPFFKGSCFIAEIQPDNGCGFLSFCYPGSIPGHTFAMTDNGQVMTVNNLRLPDIEARIPRMVVCRAALTARSQQEAIEILSQHSSSGGFHVTLGQSGPQPLMSVEFGAGQVSVREISLPAVHANHALHLARALSDQIITRSSADRQARGDWLLDNGIHDPLTILNDREGPGLPIRREAPDDPDHENTLATALFRIGQNSIDWQIYEAVNDKPVWSGKKSTR